MLCYKYVSANDGMTLTEAGSYVAQIPGPTVFREMWNFEQSHGICPWPRNSYVSAEFDKRLMRDLLKYVHIFDPRQLPVLSKQRATCKWT